MEKEFTKNNQLEYNIRHHRDILLVHIDKFQNILLYDDLNHIQKKELKDYRLALLESPKNLKLPKAPDWLFDGI